jgi:hypothetical protein
MASSDSLHLFVFGLDSMLAVGEIPYRNKLRIPYTAMP